MTVDQRPPTRTRSMIQDMIALLRDNPLLSDEEIEAVLAIPKRTIGLIRRSDAFRASLAFEIERVHGEAIRAVRNNNLLAANDALEATRRMIRDTGLLPSVKLEAIKIALDNNHRAEELHRPVGSPLAGQGGTNITINLTTQELQEAQASSLAHGRSLELEASDHAHGAPKVGRDYFLPASRKDRSEI
jgi:hypothetical protein